MMVIKVKLVKYGNSLGITLNSTIIKELYKWKKGDEVEAVYDSATKSILIREAQPP